MSDVAWFLAFAAVVLVMSAFFATAFIWLPDRRRRRRKEFEMAEKAAHDAILKTTTQRTMTLNGYKLSESERGVWHLSGEPLTGMLTFRDEDLPTVYDLLRAALHKDAADG